MADRFTVLAAQIAAHRRMLRWILLRTVDSEEDRAALLDQFENNLPPPDGQEDPGAVPTDAYAGVAAYAREIELLTEPLRVPSFKKQPER